jgi:hypothetical protein
LFAAQPLNAALDVRGLQQAHPICMPAVCATAKRDSIRRRSGFAASTIELLSR